MTKAELIQELARFPDHTPITIEVSVNTTEGVWLEEVEIESVSNEITSVALCTETMNVYDIGDGEECETSNEDDDD